jgi:hypothetical protein
MRHATPSTVAAPTLITRPPLLEPPSGTVASAAPFHRQRVRWENAEEAMPPERR